MRYTAEQQRQHGSNGSKRAWQLCLAALLSCCLASPTTAQQRLTLQQSVDLAQKQGYEAASAIATRDAAQASERAFSRRRLPQLSLTGVPAELSKNIQPVVQSDGSTAFLPVQESRARGGLTLSQQFPLTGATFSVTSF